MSPTASLSYTSQYGYYGLRVNPTFDQVASTIKKPLRVPIPERKAKWYANSPYRALILDAEAKFQDYEHASIDYKQSGAHLPESAARVRPSDAGQDPSFDEIHRHGDAMEAQHAYETAFDVMNQEHRRQTEETRRQQLGATYGANRMDPTVEANHDELEEAGVDHAMPAPRIAPVIRIWRAPNGQFASAGQPQAREFPSFEVLSMGQPATVRAASLTPSQNMTYEQARDFVVEPTWSS
jgi:hypothetical protein